MAYLKHISYFLPEDFIDNDDLCTGAATSLTPEKILNKVGISRRFRVSEGKFASDLAVNVGEKFFSEFDIARSEIDFIILCTQTPDYPLPTTACIVQDRLGLNKSCGALDINLGCSGFVYGLMLSKGLIDSSLASNVLLITAETYSLHIEKDDISNNSIFSDASSASLVTQDALPGILNFICGSDGSGYPNLISRKNSFKDRLDSNAFYMNGAEVFKFTLFSVPRVVAEVLDANQVTFDNVDWFVFHQASKVVLDAVKRKLRIPDSKFFNNIEFVGNTVSSTIPIALKDGLDSGQISKGQLVLILGFGVGYSWCGTLIRF